MPLPERHVVSCFLLCDGKILILKRSDRVGSFRGLWAAVSGFIETTPDEQVLTEIGEETGLSPKEVTLLKKGQTLTAEDNGVRWVVHPYLYRVRDRASIRIDWEHEDLRWIDPADLPRFHTVPMLVQTLAKVYPV